MQLICKKKELLEIKEKRQKKKNPYWQRIKVTRGLPQKYFAKSDKNIPLHQK